MPVAGCSVSSSWPSRLQLPSESSSASPPSQLWVCPSLWSEPSEWTRLTGLQICISLMGSPRLSASLLSVPCVCLSRGSICRNRPSFCFRLLVLSVFLGHTRRTRVLHHSVVVSGLSPSAQLVPAALFTVPPEGRECLTLKCSLPTFPLVHYFWGRAQEVLSSRLGSGQSSAGCPRNPTLAGGFSPAPPQSWVPTWICPGMGKCDSRCPHPSCCPLPHPTPSSSSRLYLPQASARPRPPFFGLTAPSTGVRPQAGAPAYVTVDVNAEGTPESPSPTPPCSP